MTTQEFKIDGMSCNHCVMAVRKGLTRLDNVKVNDVQIGSAKVDFDEKKITSNEIVKAIQEAGYTVIN